MKSASFLTYEGKIDSFSSKGEGIGDFSSDRDTRRLKVPFTTIGEEVQVCRRKKDKGFPLKILSPSPSRVDAKCIHFGVCGGCSYQHIDYPSQAQFKEQYLRDLFPEANLLPIIPAKNPYHYRNKMEPTFSSDRLGRRFLGLIAKDSGGHVFSMKECPISSAPVAKACSAALKFWEKGELLAYHPYRDEGSLQNLIVRSSREGEEVMIALVVSGNPKFALTKEKIRLFTEEMQKEFDNPSLFLLIQQRIKGQETQIFEMHLAGSDHITEEITLFDRTLSFQISPRSFFQPNSLMAKEIYQRALELLDPKEEEVIYDLFCGAGTLSLCSSIKAKEVIGIDLSYEAIVDARENLKKNGIENATFYQGDVGEVLKERAASLPEADSVVVDPPRTGLNSKQIDEILKLSPKKLIYISCNPKTLVPNIALLQERGYQLDSIQPIDQFAQTPHLEVVVKLVRT